RGGAECAPPQPAGRRRGHLSASARLTRGVTASPRVAGWLAHPSPGVSRHDAASRKPGTEKKAPALPPGAAPGPVAVRLRRGRTGRRGGVCVPVPDLRGGVVQPVDVPPVRQTQSVTPPGRG